MIGKIKRGKSFAGVCNYVLREKKQVSGRVIGGNMAGQTPPELTAEFEMFAAFNTRVKVPVKHFSLSFAEQDGVVSDDTKHLLAMDYMEQMGYGNSQYVVVDHDRTDHDHAHDHIHIVASSVAMDGTWVNDRLDWKRSQTVLRALELEHNLTPVVSSWDKDRDKSLAAKLGYQVERSLAGGMELSQIERTHSEIQSKIERAATGATSITQFCSRLQVLKIKPIAKITRTGKVQGISYGSGDVVVRGSDLKGASFPALQQRGIEFDPGRDLVNLKSVIKGVQLEVDREWVENLPVVEAENLEVATELVFTPPEILETPIVATDLVSTHPEIATIEAPLSDYEQERKDRDLIRVVADYPQLKEDPDYLAAAARSRARHQERVASMPPQEDVDDNLRYPGMFTRSVKPDKWKPTLEQPTSSELVELVLAMGQELGQDSYQAGNYSVQISSERIEIGYRDAPAMSIDLTDQEPVSNLIDKKHTINQYEKGLDNSINALLATLELQQQQQQAQEQERQHKLELEQKLVQEREEQEEREKNSISVVFDDVDDDVTVVFPADPEPERERFPDHGRSR